jgi:hypothetical protein
MITGTNLIKPEILRVGLVRCFNNQFVYKKIMKILNISHKGRKWSPNTPILGRAESLGHHFCLCALAGVFDDGSYR